MPKLPGHDDSLYNQYFMALINSRPSFPPDDYFLLAQAYEFAAAAHREQYRKSGEPYISHPLESARCVADWGADAETVAAAILHDVVEDSDISIQELCDKFGKRIANMVEAVTEVPGKSYIAKLLGRLIDPANREDGACAAAIKLADRLHNMQTIKSMPAEKQQLKAEETRKFYLPIANLVGIWVAQEELGNLVLQVQQPETYEEIKGELETRNGEHREIVAEIVNDLRSKFTEHEIGDVFFHERERKIFNDIYRRQHEKAGQRYSYQESYNTVWIVAIAKSVCDCCTLRDLILGHFEHADRSHTTRDYIKNYRDNFYRSLHVTVPYDSITIKFQIRTWEMHESADYGVMTHFRYRETRPEEAADSMKHIDFVGLSNSARRYSEILKKL